MKSALIIGGAITDRVPRIGIIAAAVAADLFVTHKRRRLRAGLAAFPALHHIVCC